MLVNESELTQKRQKDFYIDLDARLRRMEQQAKLCVRTPAAAPRGSLPRSPRCAAPGTDAESTARLPQRLLVFCPLPVSNGCPRRSGKRRKPAYESAYNLFKGRRYQDAISQFNKFLKTYPASSLAPSAHYWIGNSYYALRDFKNAISAQEKLISTYPESAKAPDAMLNIASSQQEMDKKPAAKKTWKLIRKYPGSDAADKAKAPAGQSEVANW